MYQQDFNTEKNKGMVGKKSAIRLLGLTIKDKTGIIIGFVAIFTFLSIASPVFLTSTNLLNVIKQNSVTAMIAFAMTFVLISGGIDLSVGGIMALSGMIAGILMMNLNLNIIFAIFVALVLGTLAGLVNGLIVTKLKLAPFIVTLAFGFIYRGFTLLSTSGRPIFIDKEAYLALGQLRTGIVPLQVYYMTVCFVLFLYLLNNTTFGKHSLATGGDINVAKIFGIKIDRVRIIAYTFIGFLAAFSGIITNARLNSAQPTIGTNIELDAIAAVTLGGTSLAGGYGSIGGTLIGVYLIGLITNGLNIMGVVDFWQPISKGFLILIAIYIDSLRKKRMSVF